jgi:hypothetical protein
MSATMPWELESKQLARRLAVRPVGTVCRTALFMPGRKALCVKAALESGLITRKTRCIFVERDPEIMAAMQTAVRSCRFTTQPYYHTGAISSLYLAGLLGTRRLDYAFLDFCAALTTPRAAWVHQQLAPMLADGAAMAMTLMRTARNCHFTAACVRYFEEQPHEWARAYRRIRCDCAFAGTTDGDDEIAALTRGAWVSHPCEESLEAGMMPLFHNASVDAAAMIQGLLPHHQTLFDTCLEYKTSPGRSGSRMVVLRTRNLRRDSLRRSRLSHMLTEMLSTDTSGVGQR